MKHLLSQVLLGSGLLLPVGASHAQTTWSIGPQVGTNFANCRSAGASNSGYRFGWVAGAQGRLSWRHFALASAVLFAQQGNTSSQAIDYQDPVTGLPDQHGTYTTQLRLNYLTLPLHVTFAPAASAHGPQVFAGPYLSVLLGGTYSQAGPTQAAQSVPVLVASAPTQYTGYYAQRYDAGVQAGVGYRFEHLVLQAAYSLGLRDVRLGYAFAVSAFNAPPEYNRAFQASVSYLVDLKH
jgi:hypothetical protein